MLKGIFGMRSLMLVILSIVALASAFLAAGSAHAASCEQYKAGSTISGSFGMPYNLFSANKETIITADCGADGITIAVGSGQTTQYVYRYGYVWNEATKSWDRKELAKTGTVYGDWLVGKATISLPVNDLSQSDNFVVAYVCSWTGRAWKCGCRDATCTQSYWQIQSFKPGAASCVDNDHDGFDNCATDGDGKALDCNDANVAIKPGATEICGNSIDEDCSGSDAVCENTDAVCVDNDHDGFDNCATGGDGKALDCNDNEINAYPGNAETCDTVNNDCDTATDEGCDDDGDRYCDSNMKIYRNNTMCPLTVFTEGRDGNDCNDTNPAVSPAASEICGNGIDENCSKTADEGCPVCTNGAVETKGTNEGICNVGTRTCVNGQWSAWTGQISAKFETCNQLDDDCDGAVDEAGICNDITDEQKQKNCYACLRTDSLCPAADCTAQADYCRHFTYPLTSGFGDACYATCSNGYISGSDYSCKQCLIDANCSSSKVCSGSPSYSCVDCTTANVSKCADDGDPNKAWCSSNKCIECTGYPQCASGYYCNTTAKDCVQGECTNTTSFPSEGYGCPSAKPVCTPAGWDSSDPNEGQPLQCIECWKNSDCSAGEYCSSSRTCVAGALPSNVQFKSGGDGSNKFTISWTGNSSMSGCNCTFSFVQNASSGYIVKAPCNNNLSGTYTIPNQTVTRAQTTAGFYTYHKEPYFMVSCTDGRSYGSDIEAESLMPTSNIDALHCTTANHQTDDVTKTDNVDNDCDGQFDESSLKNVTIEKFTLGTCGGTETICEGSESAYCLDAKYVSGGYVSGSGAGYGSPNSECKKTNGIWGLGATCSAARAYIVCQQNIYN